MLNIRINVSIDMRKVWRVASVLMLSLSNLILPPTSEALVVPSPNEKSVTAYLTYMNVTTTKSQAKKALAGDTVKYFDAEALAFLTVYAKDWKMREWKCLRNIWKKESHFNPKAKNKSSGAYGIAQFLPTTWGNYKVEKTAEAKLQIQYGLRYILKRYGDTNDPNGACNAWAFWQRNGWY